MRTQSNLVLVLLLSFLSFGFIMEVQWPWMQKKEFSKEQKPQTQSGATTQATQITAAAVEAKSQPESQTVKPETSVVPEESQIVPVTSEAGSTPFSQTAETVVETTSGNRPDLEMAKIQEQLQTIVAQTKIIQTQGQADRARLKNVMDQVQIQIRLVETLKLQKPPVVQNVANTDEILRNTKIRLLAEEVQKTRAAFDTIQPAVQTQQVISKPIKSVSIPKPQKTA